MKLDEATNLIQHYGLQLTSDIADQPKPSASEIAVHIYNSAFDDGDRHNKPYRDKAVILDYLVQIGKVDKDALIEAGYYPEAITEAYNAT